MAAKDGEVVEESVAWTVYGDENEIYPEIARALRGEKAFAVKPAEALALTRVFDAIRTSSQENRVVTLQ